MEQGEEEVHHCIGCDGCNMSPIIGPRYRCVDCMDEFSLCQTCLDSKGHLPDHRLFQISPPWEPEQARKSMAKQALEFMKDDVLVRAEKERKKADESLIFEQEMCERQGMTKEQIHENLSIAWPYSRSMLAHCAKTKVETDAIFVFVKSHMKHLQDIIDDNVESPYWEWVFQNY